jgi:hypothetical protein
VKLLLLGQPASGLAELTSQLSLTISQAPPPVTPLHIEAWEEPPAPATWATLQAGDLVLLIESSAETVIDWRQVLLALRLPFQVLFPSTSLGLLQEVLWAVGQHLKHHTGNSPWPLRDEILARWQGICEKCSDPDCEHRLFRRLMNPPPR